MGGSEAKGKKKSLRQIKEEKYKKLKQSRYLLANRKGMTERDDADWPGWDERGKSALNL